MKHIEVDCHYKRESHVRRNIY